MRKLFLKYLKKRINSFFLKNTKNDLYKNSSSFSENVIAEYNQTRDNIDRSLICHAPFKNIYFNIQGDAAPCWLTFKDPDSYPAKSIKEIWFGKTFENLRENIRKCDLSGKCSVCEHYIESGNYVTPLARAYDNDYKIAKYPVMMELELANTCNLECVMCNGRLSSSYRKNTEKLPPHNIPYDDAFVEQLLEFIPHLEEARFNGGEPFLNEIYFKIWEQILNVKPSMKVVIATNGTVLNDKVKTLLENGKFDINLSLDSLTKEIYESIRINAHFETTMKNIEYFHDYCKRKGTTLCILTNPMRQNWQEMPEFIRFCNERNLPIWFNTIHRPYEYALWTLSSNELTEIFDKLTVETFSTNPLNPQTFHNKKVYNNLVNSQIKTWINEALEREKNHVDIIDEVKPEEIIVDDPEAYFYKSFNVFLLEKKTTNNIQSKFKIIVDDVSKELPRKDFFNKIIQIPIEKVVMDLETETIETLCERAKKL